MSIIKLNNITKIYGQNLVLNNVSMEIDEGEIYGFVGANGAGKTTIIRIINGLVRPNSGTYSLFDIDSKDKRIYECRKKIGTIVETPFFYPNLNKYENIKMQETLLGIEDPDKEIMNDILDIVGLGTADPNLPASKYSLGMKQRLGIAMALVGDKKLIILDEPLNGVDPEGIVEIRNLILKLNQERNITFLISSHILSELALIATKVGIISRGNILAEVSKEELDKETKKSIIITTTDNAKAFTILQEIITSENLDYFNEKITISGVKDQSEIIMKLASNNISLTSIEIKEGSLEDYYLKLIGGNR